MACEGDWNNDKTAMTEDATFQTLSRLCDLGTENEAYWITDESLSSEYVVSVDAAYLPARFTGQTRFKLTVNGLVYYFEAAGLGLMSIRPSSRM